MAGQSAGLRLLMRARASSLHCGKSYLRNDLNSRYDPGRPTLSAGCEADYYRVGYRAMGYAVEDASDTTANLPLK